MSKKEVCREGVIHKKRIHNAVSDPLDGSPKDAAFVALQAEWYGRLKESGFDDIEVHENEDNHFLSRSANERWATGLIDGTAELFRLAEMWLHVGQWPTRRDRIFFAQWADGLSLRSIHANGTTIPEGALRTLNLHHSRHVESMIEYYRARVGDESEEL